MIERLIEKLDLLPGGKTYWLAGAAAVLFWGNLVGLIPENLYDTALQWLSALMLPTVALKLVRK
ncbi:MAG: hypothetical protein V3R16_02475 [Nitrospirales bacterium]